MKGEGAVERYVWPAEDIPTIQITLVNKQLLDESPAAARAVVGKTNMDVWRGWPAGEWLCISVEWINGKGCWAVFQIKSVAAVGFEHRFSKQLHERADFLTIFDGWELKPPC